MLNNNILIFNADDFPFEVPQTMTGLIAMAVVSKYHRPCILGRFNSDDELVGSLRSQDAFAGLPDFKQFLTDSTLVDYTIGHPSAAGVGIKESKIDDLINYGNNNLNAADFENCYYPDYVLNADNDNSELFSALARGQKFFGNYIDEPKIIVKNIDIANAIFMGKDEDSIKLTQGGVDYIRFKDEDLADKLKDPLNYGLLNSTLIAYGRPNLNTFNGRMSVQFFIDNYDFEEQDLHGVPSLEEDKYAF